MVYEWSILDIFGDETITKVRYLLKLQDGAFTVETEGYHEFTSQIILRPLEENTEFDLKKWLELDTIKDGVNPLKLNLENQLKALKTSKTIEFPWKNDTFTIG
jgi:hypothetical protein